MADDDSLRAWGYASAALDLLKRSGIPPFPHYFELLYTYATGVNPSLNTRINSIFRQGGNPDAEAAEQLYQEFIRTTDVGERLNSVTERMQQRIDKVNRAIGSAVQNAHDYGESLQSASGLSSDISADKLRSIATHLIGETRRVQQTNSELESQLEASRDDIAALQRDLEAVRRDAMLDPLTKIANRKAFDDGIENLIEHARAKGNPLCLLMLDIDNFKRFNDTYGHQTGDQVLRLMAMTLTSNIKGQDLAARYGGEEFAAILPATELQGAVVVAENIRKAIQAKELLKRSTNERLGRITISVGVALLHANDTSATLIERADKCLYAAKSAGRNLVVSEVQLRGTRAA